MSIHFRYIEGVPAKLKTQIQYLANWIRSGYGFPVPLEIKLINRQHLIDFDGTKCHLRWWQLDNQDESFKVQIAVGTFTSNLRNEGPTVAYPTVVAAVGRALGYYFQAIDDHPDSEQLATQWGDSLLEAYCNDGIHPHPNPWLNPHSTDA